MKEKQIVKQKEFYNLKIKKKNQAGLTSNYQNILATNLNDSNNLK